MKRTGAARSQEGEFSSQSATTRSNCFHQCKWSVRIPRQIILIGAIGFLAVSIRNRVVADDTPPAAPDRVLTTSVAPPIIRDRFPFFSKSRSYIDLLDSPLMLPRMPRVSRSLQPLYRIDLVGGDRFWAECLEWSPKTVRFRLLNRQTVNVLTSTISSLRNPVGEIGVLDESFETEVTRDLADTTASVIVDNDAADGRRLLKVGTNANDHRIKLPRPLDSARIEFSFQIQSVEAATDCGTWQLVTEGDSSEKSDSIVRVGSDRRVRFVAGPSIPDGDFQTISLSEGWHTFLALVTPQTTRLIIDEFLLASYSTPASPIREIRFQSAPASSKNLLWIDAVKVRRIFDELAPLADVDRSIGIDRIVLEDGGEIFGQLTGLTRSSAELEVFGRRAQFPWTRVIGLHRNQASKPIQQTGLSETGLVSTIELQPFVDRPNCDPECWTATIVRSNSKQLVARHWAVGELAFDWSEIRQIIPHDFCRSMMIDARQFHLGNSIRSDFHRHRPDATHLRIDFSLSEIPSGQPSLSFDVAEMEAAGPTAPPASPYLKQLRAGQLLTEVYVNDQRVGDLNSQIRFKTRSNQPERIRLSVSRDLLKPGENSIRLFQKPLDDTGREFDDCEIGSIRLEFDPLN